MGILTFYLLVCVCVFFFPNETLSNKYSTSMIMIAIYTFYKWMWVGSILITIVPIMVVHCVLKLLSKKI